MATCELCGEPMPGGEEMFKYHGYSGPCPKPPLPRPADEKYMPEAWYIVEDHIRHFGMVPHPDVLKEAIAKALSRLARGVSPI